MRSWRRSGRGVWALSVRLRFRVFLKGKYAKSQANRPAWFGVLESLPPRYLLSTVHFTIDPSQNVHSISRLIYGVNGTIAGYNSPTFVRMGGNRWTAYNWENNDSNAGSDYYFQNDDALSSSTSPGAAVLPEIQSTAANGQGLLLTIPMNGYVSADRNGGGDVRYNNNTYDPSDNGWIDGTPNPNYLSQRFVPEYPAKPGGPASFSLNPSTTDDAVYEDEFVNWVNHQAGSGQQVSYDLDNEPDLWSSTHAEVHPNNATYQEIINDSIAYATAIKAVSPNALIYGGVNYGWQGYVDLQNGPNDSSINDTILNFQASYLKAMHAADQAAGKRLVDVLDMHWYPEALGTNGVRISGTDTSAATDAARIQAPRSLWDPTYVENSWITQDSLPYQPAGTPAQFKNDAIQLLPREEAIINEYDPGMKLSLSEYNYGGGTDISGAIAEADVLGILGQQGVYSANEWPNSGGEPFIGAGLNMYRNYDGSGSTFGDTSISASTDDVPDSSVYASLDSQHPGVLTIVAINKTGGAMPTNINLKNILAQGVASVYQVTSASSTPKSAGTITISDPSNISYTMPAMSVSTIRIQLTAPSVTSSAYAYQTSPNKLTFMFNQNVAASLAANDVSVVGSSASVPLTLVSYNSTSNTATFSMPTPLADGNYSVTVTGSGVNNLAAQAMAANYTTSFFVLTGDANHDGHVNASDFDALATNYGKSGQNYATGDFDYNGIVNTADFNLLAAHFNASAASAPAAANALSLSQSPPANLFGNAFISPNSTNNDILTAEAMRSNFNPIDPIPRQS